METILKTVSELAGVTTTFVFNGQGQVLASQGQSIYDAELLQEISGGLVKSLESVQLQTPDWETVTAQFEEGRLTAKSLGKGADGHSYVLAMVSDTQLKAFAAVALRVAVQKLKAVLDGGTPASSSPALPTPLASTRVPLPPPPPPPSAAASQPAMASSGMTWSKTGQSSASSGIDVVDAAASAFLSRCTKEYARCVGPMSKVYVKEAVRRVSPSAPFAVALARKVVEDLAGQVDNPEKQARFRKAMENL